MSTPRAIALTIAGSDSGGGAGIQADLKTFHQLGVYGSSVVTAVTAQNTLGVRAVHPVSLDVVSAQIAAVAEDLRPAALKTGMLATAELVATVADSIRAHGLKPLVVDPVMVATSGDTLLEPAAIEVLVEELLPLAEVATPNVPEAELLAGFEIENVHDLVDAGRRILDLGPSAVLLKGGHLSGDLVDVLVTADSEARWSRERIETPHTHGTGCTLSAAIAAGLAIGLELSSAVERGIGFVGNAIASAPGLGSGHGPVNHFADVS